MNGTNIEEARLELERKRLVLEQRRAEREGGFLNRHFSAIITAMVSVATVVVTMTISQTQIEVAKIHKFRELEVQQRESERQWRIEAARFIASNRSAILSNDDLERDMMKHVIEVAFPKDISNGLNNGITIFEKAVSLEKWLGPPSAQQGFDSQKVAKIKDCWEKIGVPGSTFFIDFMFQPKYLEERLQVRKCVNYMK